MRWCPRRRLRCNRCLLWQRGRRWRERRHRRRGRKWRFWGVGGSAAPGGTGGHSTSGGTGGGNLDASLDATDAAEDADEPIECSPQKGPGCYTCGQVFNNEPRAEPTTLCGWSTTTKSAGKIKAIVDCWCDPEPCGDGQVRDRASMLALPALVQASTPLQPRPSSHSPEVEHAGNASGGTFVLRALLPQPLDTTTAIRAVAGATACSRSAHATCSPSRPLLTPTRAPFQPIRPRGERGAPNGQARRTEVMS